MPLKLKRCQLRRDNQTTCSFPENPTACLHLGHRLQTAYPKFPGVPFSKPARGLSDEGKGNQNVTRRLPIQYGQSAVIASDVNKVRCAERLFQNPPSTFPTEPLEPQRGEFGRSSRGEAASYGTRWLSSSRNLVSNERVSVRRLWWVLTFI